MHPEASLRTEIKLALGICEGMVALTSRGIAHGDLSAGWRGSGLQNFPALQLSGLSTVSKRLNSEALCAL